MNAAYLVRSDPALEEASGGAAGLLERHHCALACSLMARAGLLAGLSEAAAAEVTDMVRSAILSTDLGLHAEYVAAIARPAGHGPEDGGGGCGPAAAGGSRGGAQRVCPIRLLLKCADVSNAFKPWDVARAWAVRVTDEFFAQGDRERAAGLAVSPGCDRRAASRAAVQRGFIDGVVAPLLRGAAARYPGFRPHLAQLEENRRRWEGYTDGELLGWARAQGRAVGGAGPDALCPDAPGSGDVQGRGEARAGSGGAPFVSDELCINGEA